MKGSLAQSSIAIINFADFSGLLIISAAVSLQLFAHPFQ